MPPAALNSCSAQAAQRAQRRGAVAASSVLHVAVLIAAAMVVVPRGERGAGRQSAFDLQNVAESTPHELSLLAEALMSAPTDDPASLATVLAPAEAPAAAPRMQARTALSPIDWGPAPGELAQSFRGSGVGGPGGNGSGAGGVFLKHQPSESVVYVVDCSLSMNHPYPGPAKTRFVRVKLELLESVRRLDPAQQFFIVFFNDQALPMPAEHLAVASDSNKRRFLEWMASVRATGNTDPRAALLGALKLQPDVVYFLTDGDFRKGIIGDVTRTNSGRTTIHTIGFGDDAGAPMLKEIARRNGGAYTFISGEAADAAGDADAGVDLTSAEHPDR